MSALAPRTLVWLLRSDALNVGRDPVLMLGVVLWILPTALLVVFGDAAEAAAASSLGFSGMPDLLGTMVMVMAGAMLGWITGFLLLEDRDESVLMALQVTPIGRNGFIAYRLAVCFALVTVLALVIARLTLPELSFLASLGAAVITGGYGLIVALFLLAFAGNKVEGLALTKLVNLALFAPALALAPAPWRYVAGVVPPFWIGEIAQLGPDALDWPLALLLGIVATVGISALLTHRLRRRLG